MQTYWRVGDVEFTDFNKACEYAERVSMRVIDIDISVIEVSEKVVKNYRHGGELG